MMPRLWDPDYVLALHEELRARIFAGMKQIVELGEGPNPSHTLDDFADEHGISREMVLGVMLAGQLLETDRELNALSPDDRERAKAFLAEQEAELIQTAHEISDTAWGIASEAEADLEMLNEMWDLPDAE